MKHPLDAQDAKILDLLVRNGRASVSDVAAHVGLSRPAVAERMEKLQKQGVIQGYTAVVKDYPDENPMIAFVAARHPGLLKGRAETAVYELSRRREILEVHGVAGEDCIYMKVRVKDIAELNRLIRELQQPPLLMETRTTIVLNTYFEKVSGINVTERPRKERER